VLLQETYSEELPAQPYVVAFWLMCRMMKSFISAVREMSKELEYCQWVHILLFDVFFCIMHGTLEVVKTAKHIRILTCIHVYRLHQYQQFGQRYHPYQDQSHHHVYHYHQFKHHQKQLKIALQALASCHLHIRRNRCHCKNCYYHYSRDQYYLQYLLSTLSFWSFRCAHCCSTIIIATRS